MSLRKKRRMPATRGKIAVEHTAFYPYLQRYLEARLLRGFSAETQKSHDSNLRRFIAWCEERGLGEPQSVTKPILERYRKHLYYARKTDGEPLSFSSQNVALTILRSFFKWLTKENYLLYNPASEVELPKRPKKLPYAMLSVDAVKTLLNQPDIHDPEGLRDRAIMELLYGCGLRRFECAKLKLNDIDLKRQLLVVKGGKGSKDRVLPIGDSATHWVLHYFEESRPLLLPVGLEDTVFLSAYGAPLSGGVLGSIVKRYMKRAEIEMVGSCHLLRHAMATHMLENGADIRFIQAMLGHEDLNTTQIYTRVSVEKLREIHAATHPAKLDSRNREAELLSALALESELERKLDSKED